LQGGFRIQPHCPHFIGSKRHCSLLSKHPPPRNDQSRTHTSRPARAYRRGRHPPPPPPTPPLLVFPLCPPASPLPKYFGEAHVGGLGLHFGTPGQCLELQSKYF
jgi:hypothetical protein